MSRLGESHLPSVREVLACNTYSVKPICFIKNAKHIVLAFIANDKSKKTRVRLSSGI